MKIGLLLYPDCMPAGLLAFADLLLAANRRAGHEAFSLCYVAHQPGAVACAHGVLLSAAEGLDDAALDALLVPSFWAESVQQVSTLLAANQPLLRQLARLPVPLWSYCTGVCLLAASGRLQGRVATLTWWLVDAMSRQFPEVQWRNERLWVIDQDVASACGVNGYLPLASELIQQHLGAEVFQDLQRLMVLPRPVQAHPAFQGLSLIEHASPLLRQVQLWVEDTPAEQATVARLAAALGLAERTLARRVAAEQGQPLATWVRTIKLNQVSQRLLYSRASIGQISEQLGFSSDSNLSRMFKRLTGLAPQDYRQRFGGGE